MATSLDIGTLSGKITLEDLMSEVLAKVDARMRQFDQSLVRSGESMTKAAFLGTFLGSQLSNLAERAVSFGKNIVDSSILAGARLEQLATISVFLGERAGYSAKFINELSTAIEKSGITGTESRNAIVQLEKAHVDLSKASELSATAQNMATLSGRGSSETYGMMINAITTMNSQILKSAGFTFTMDQVLERYTATTGKSTAAMGMHEKQGLLVNAMLKEGAEFGGLYELSMGTAAKQLASAARVWLQVGEVIGTSFLPVSNVAIGAWYKLGTAVRDSMKDVSSTVTPIMKDAAASLQVVVGETAKLLIISVDAGKSLVEAYKEVPDVFKFIGRDAIYAAGTVWLLNTALESMLAKQVWLFLTGFTTRLELMGLAATTAWGSVVTFTTGLLALEGAAGMVAIAFAYVIIPIAAAVAVATALYNIYKLVTESSARAADAQVQLGIDQLNLAKINESTGKSFTTLAEAVKYVQDNAENARNGFLPLASTLKALSESAGNSIKPLRDMETTVIGLGNKGELPTSVMRQVAAAIKASGVAAEDLPPALKAVQKAMEDLGDIVPDDAISAFSKKVTALWQTLGQADEPGKVMIRFFDELYPSVRLAGESTAKFEERLTAATNRLPLTAEAVRKLTPEFESLTNAHVKLTKAMENDYLAGVTANLQVMDEERASLISQKLTLEKIESLKALGYSLQNIATVYNVSTEAIGQFGGALEASRVLSENITKTERAMQHDSFSDWLKDKQEEVARHTQAAKEKQQATASYLLLEQQDLAKTVQFEIQKRAEGISGSRESFVKLRDEAKNNYAFMLVDRENFSDEMIRIASEEANQRERDLANWRTSSTNSGEAVFQKWKESTDRSSDSFKTWLFNVASDTQKAELGFDAMGRAIKRIGDQAQAAEVLVHTLTGEYINAAEAKRRLDEGGSQAVTSQNFEQAINSLVTSGGWNPAGTGSNVSFAEAINYAHQGYSMAEIISIFALKKQGAGGKIPPPQGPAIPGMVEGKGLARGTSSWRGGEAWVGEEGPERVFLPAGSSVIPAAESRRRFGVPGFAGGLPGGRSAMSFNPTDEELAEAEVRHAREIVALSSINELLEVVKKAKTEWKEGEASNSKTKVEIAQLATQYLEVQKAYDAALLELTSAQDDVREHRVGVTNPQTGRVTPTPPSVTLAPGSIVLNYPIIRDRAAMDQLAAIVNEAVGNRLADRGARRT
jgi:hypothetical protein